ncbi:MAG TPA: protein kinase [Thermoanaerobaculia bacterium]|nr:protein kinase [Thermoanaerobaculia bacterium]
MTLAAGTKLGPYEILSPIGAGGMGEVYRARDTRLGRDVAVKVLPTAMSSSPELRQRLEREAKTISQLSHPHICTLFDVGHQDGTDYLVMEYLEGETLANRLGKGPMPIEQALRIGTEIAGALDAAHRSGIVHRDLKPGNVMLTKSGVKLLDFGLAKLAAPQPGAVSQATSLPTALQESEPLTTRGTILGTFQYMAPEQLEGREADARSDIFSLGCVLYEMLTGHKAFTGKSQASLIGSIMHSEPPPMSSVQPMISPALDRIVKGCLAKEPEHRWSTAHDVMLQLQWIAEGGSLAGLPAPVVARRKNREKLAWAVAAVAVLAAFASTVGYLRRAPRPSPGVHATLQFPEKMFLGDLAISPDGTRLAFTAAKAGGQPDLWIRSLDGSSAQPVVGAEDASFVFWSPDSRFVGFFSGKKLKRVDLAGGTVQTICDADRGVGGTWNRDGTIVFGPAPTSALFRVPASGGQPVPVTKLDASRHETAHRYPQFLPDGRHFLYMAANLAGPPDDPANAIRVGSLDGSLDKMVVRTLSNAAYASGRLLYAREGTLFAHRFDLSRLETRGDPTPAAQKVGVSNWQSFTLFSVSDGVLVTSPTFAPSSRLLWLDRSGREVGSIGEAAPFLSPRLSPDGRKVAVDIFDPVHDASDIWIYDVASGAGTKFVSGTQAHEIAAVWSPDGSRIVFASDRQAKGVRPNLWIKPLEGGKEELFGEAGESRTPEDWSRDGRALSCNVIPISGRRNNQIWIVDTGAGHRASPFAVEALAQFNSRFSPDGRWIAYDSDESGRAEVYVRPFPSGPGTWQISTAGGAFPNWSRDGKELFFLSLDFKLMAVPITADAKFHAGTPVALFAVHPAGSSVYDVSPDGRRFLVNSLASDVGSPPFDLLIHWTALLEKTETGSR